MTYHHGALCHSIKLINNNSSFRNQGIEANKAGTPPGWGWLGAWKNLRSRRGGCRSTPLLLPHSCWVSLDSEGTGCGYDCSWEASRQVLRRSATVSLPLLPTVSTNNSLLPRSREDIWFTLAENSIVTVHCAPGGVRKALWDKDVRGGGGSHSNCYFLHDFGIEIRLPAALKVLTKTWELVVLEWNPLVQRRYVQLKKQGHLLLYIIF